MPFVSVEVVGELDSQSDTVAQELADACSPSFPPDHREVWVRVRYVSEREWAVSGRRASRPYPVFVYVVREQNPTGEDLQRELVGLTEAVARVTERPMEAVAVEYEASASGRLAFGGQLVGRPDP